MKNYLDILRNIRENGEDKKDRTGTGTYAIAGSMFEHDMSKGFPLLTTKKVPMRLVASELEFFIKGGTSKAWLQARNNHIWDEWCCPQKVPYSLDLVEQQKMRDEMDLGPIYGYQWRNFNGIDQFMRVIDQLKKDPDDRGILCTAWNPKDLHKMALRPCHYGFQLTVINGKLNLMWNQRSVDIYLGAPFNIASYGLLLHLFARELGLKEGRLVGFLADVHLYKNHIEQADEQLQRESMSLCRIKTPRWSGIFNWNHDDTVVMDYNCHPTIKAPIAI